MNITIEPSQLFKALSDPTRLQMLLLIADQEELCVCELTTALEESQPKVSRHLAQLRKTNILSDRRQGQWVYYQLNKALPGWAVEVIRTTLKHNQGSIEPLKKHLCGMGDRPQRQAACCP
ncbi:metalloregulator ArsR/SmtB family transcription factor [Porticoccaceae bacterium LTM1]|nr:metalloregulator ArsR/SmtB family transcription factor [Porticoccaceae bacterium LTM1]